MTTDRGKYGYDIVVGEFVDCAGKQVERPVGWVDGVSIFNWGDPSAPMNLDIRQTSTMDNWGNHQVSTMEIIAATQLDEAMTRLIRAADQMKRINRLTPISTDDSIRCTKITIGATEDLLRSMEHLIEEATK